MFVHAFLISGSRLLNMYLNTHGLSTCMTIFNIILFILIRGLVDFIIMSRYNL